jgi:hypothetical protein
VSKRVSLIDRIRAEMDDLKPLEIPRTTEEEPDDPSRPPKHAV